MCENNEIGADDITYTSTKKDDFMMSENKTLREYTCDIIRYSLKKHNDDVIATANALDIGKSTIYKMIQNGEVKI